MVQHHLVVPRVRVRRCHRLDLLALLVLVVRAVLQIQFLPVVQRVLAVLVDQCLLLVQRVQGVLKYATIVHFDFWFSTVIVIHLIAIKSK